MSLLSLFKAPSFMLIANAKNHSFSLVPEVLYAGFKNLELCRRLALSHGHASTYFGEKTVQSRLELRTRYFF